MLRAHRTVYTVLSKNVQESKCLFVVSYAIIYFSKNEDFIGIVNTLTAVTCNFFLDIFDTYLCN